jgi:predicted transcriptional regulator
MSDQKTLHISSDLEARLDAIARHTGQTVEELADTVLRAHADAQERDTQEEAEDERRWQRYLETGQSVSLDTVRGKLSTLADQAAKSADPQ